MQLMCDALAVLGSRHGLLWDPIRSEVGLIRFSRFDKMVRGELRAGVVIGDRTLHFPFCGGGERFGFFDQRMTPCTMALIGIDTVTNLKVTLTVTTPFRPRDREFSTTPVLHVAVTAEALPGNFRWTPKEPLPGEITVFLEVAGEGMEVTASGEDAVDLTFDSMVTYPTHSGEGEPQEGRTTEQAQHDRLVALHGTLAGTRFVQKVQPEVGTVGSLSVAWCTWHEPTLEIHGQKKPFWFAKAYPSLEAVADWARQNPEAIPANAAKVDGLILDNNLPQPTNFLLAQTLHSWLINTWWVDREDGRDWVSTWEGNCYFHSTVDVEFTQSPFYLAVWPELLASELDFWPEFTKDGVKVVGERGAGTLFLSHDVGSGAACNGQVYHHEMEVEEVANYLILAFAYWRRTGDDALVRKHGETIQKFAAFIRACDTTGNGVPDQGVSNTIDDASPAVQFGTEQVYLAVKSLAALASAKELLTHIGSVDEAFLTDLDEATAKIRTSLDDRGWNEGYYNTLLEKSGELTNPWTGHTQHFEAIPGWDAPHIYTANALPPLDLVGFDLGLNEDHLKADLVNATARCLREYGCVHTDFSNDQLQSLDAMEGLAGASSNPGWISMNMLRDLAAAYRRVDLRELTARYWNWQATTNTQEPKIFFETFNGNNLSWYPRGLALWGLFDAFRGQVIDQVAGVDTTKEALPGVKVNRLWDAQWE